MDKHIGKRKPQGNQMLMQLKAFSEVSAKLEKKSEKYKISEKNINSEHVILNQMTHNEVMHVFGTKIGFTQKIDGLMDCTSQHL